MGERPIPILELCAGYGGLGRAVESLTGERVRYVAEIDPYAALILATRYPHAPNIGDITQYDWSKLRGQVDIITAGFPCQDISNAGKRVGIRGARSGIWENVAESVRVLRPRYVFLENVSAIRTRGLSVVLGDLAEIGYDAKWTCFRASGTGAAHVRDRWFCIATPATDSDGKRRIARA
ncbi:DNA cytosine methyltransferase [Kitasatospora sp. NPDC002040]|uniref:DNA cytosine methyltransferase n=1 Tax=Kitasatospora sp. NPDC002040 TaxID=3154661 RepID=UPI003320D4EC